MNSIEGFKQSVLRQINKNPIYTDRTGSFQSYKRLKQAFSGVDDDFVRLNVALRSLHAQRYLRLVDENLVDGETDIYQRYQLTPLGEEALAGSAQITNISHNQKSNIAHQSPNSIQTIDISGYDESVREKFAELQAAIEAKDKITIKKTIGYILDKSVDLGIQIIANGIGRMG